MATMASRSDIEAEFPEIQKMENTALRDNTLALWERVVRNGNFESIHEVPWAPHLGDVVDEETLLPHIQDVLALSMNISETLVQQRDITVDTDAVIAGALFHDISKFFEFEGESVGEIREQLGHPFFGVYLLEVENIPTEIQHIVVSHTPHSPIQPQTLEAKIVRLADQLAEAGIFQENAGTVKEQLDI